MERIMRITRQGTVALAVLLALGCSDDDSTDTTGAYSLAVNPAVLTLPQGGTGAVTVTLTRIGGFGGPVTLAVSGLPAGITTTITPPQLTGNVSSAVIDVAVAGTVAVGNHIATVTATAQGVGQVTLAFTVSVTAP
jgi:hypothetical protein